MADLTGKTIGQYEILSRLGRGGMADVYKAFHSGLEAHRAFKVIRPEFAAERGFKERFRREARAVAGLRHPGIVQMHDSGEQDGLFYMVMEFIDGRDLRGVLQESGTVRPISEAVRIVREVALSLGEAHRQGLVHRDIKPSNIMLTEDGKTILTDFGVAKIVASEERMTATGVGIGTPAYMSPEQARGAKDVGPRTDLYALGIVLYELLTGRVPFNADTPLAVMYKVVHDPLPPPRSVTTEVPQALEGVILKATTKRAEDRYDSAESFAAALEESERVGVADTLPGKKSQFDAVIESSADEGGVLPTLAERGASWQRLALAGSCLVLLLLVSCVALWTVRQRGASEPLALVFQEEVGSDRSKEYGFRARSGDRISIVLASQFEGQGAAALRLLDSHSEELASQSRIGSASLEIREFELEEGGRYEVVVEVADSISGSYTLSIARPAILEAPTTVGEVISDSLDLAGQAKKHTFEASAGQRVSLVLDPGLGKGSSLQVLNPDGSELTTNAVFGNYVQIRDHELVQTGAHSVFVRFQGSASGPYTLSIALPAVVTTPFEIGQMMNGAIDLPGEGKRHDFEASSGDVISVVLDNRMRGDINMQLLGPNGSVLGSARKISGAVEMKNKSLAESGPHAIVVRAAGPKTGPYGLAVANPAVDVSPIVIGEALRASVDPPGEVRRFEFEAMAGEQLGVSLSHRIFTSGVGLFLVGPEEETLGSIRRIGTQNMSIGPREIPADGTYAAVVSLGGTGAGSFTVTVWRAEG